MGAVSAAGKTKSRSDGVAARHLPIDHAFLDRVSRNQLAADGEPCIGVGGASYAKFPQGPGEALHMAIEIDELSIQNRDHFIHRVRKEEAPVEHRHLALGFGDVAAVEIDGAHIFILPLANGHGWGQSLKGQSPFDKGLSQAKRRGLSL